jgi:hypothetical protein
MPKKKKTKAKAVKPLSAAIKKKPRRKAAKKARKLSLGRPTISGEEKLFMLFHEDYEARQVFEFLRADTVAELERFTPQEIIHRLSRPIRETVDRIRKRLADRNRCLAGDQEFAIEHKRTTSSP